MVPKFFMFLSENVSEFMCADGDNIYEALKVKHLIHKQQIILSACVQVRFSLQL